MSQTPASHSAVKVLGDDRLRAIARELVETVRQNVTIDWTMRENGRAQLRVLVKRILRKHGYPFTHPSPLPCFSEPTPSALHGFSVQL